MLSLFYPTSNIFLKLFLWSLSHKFRQYMDKVSKLRYVYHKGCRNDEFYHYERYEEYGFLLLSKDHNKKSNNKYYKEAIVYTFLSSNWWMIHNLWRKIKWSNFDNRNYHDEQILEIITPMCLLKDSLKYAWK